MDFYRKQIVTLIMGLSSLFVLQSCCESEKLGDVMLPEEAKARIPYQENGNPLIMVDSGGNEIEFEVYRRSQIEDDGYGCGSFTGCCRSSYFDYEKEYAGFKGDSTVQWSINIKQSLLNKDSALKYPVMYFRVKSPNSLEDFTYVSPVDSFAFERYKDNIRPIGNYVVGGVNYSNVYKLGRRFNDTSSYENYDPDQYYNYLYYNEANGVLKVQFKNGETLELKD